MFIVLQVYILLFAEVYSTTTTFMQASDISSTIVRQIAFGQLFYYHKHTYDTHISLRQFYVLGIMVIKLLIEP